MLEDLKNSRQKQLLLAVVLLGCIIRLYALGDVPGGLNQDEASAGYEAFSLLKYGIDRNGIKNPVHLLAWGSGQNIAYSWLCMPFIALMGLSVFSVRLPMALIGCISVVVFRIFVKEICGEKYTVWAALFFAVYPWHIMKSRWALESNLFPDLVLWGCVLLVLFIKRQKAQYLYAAVVIFSFSVYSYGTAYMFMPLFMGGLWIYMLINKKISHRQFIFSALLCFVFVLPVLLFVIINVYDLPQMSFMGFTIPKMHQQRFSTVMRTGGSLLQSCTVNIKEFVQILLNQGDGLPWNSMRRYGICYYVFLPLIPLGMAISVLNRKKHGFLMNWWFICAFMVIAVTDVNVNRANIVFIPLAYYIVVAIVYISGCHKAASCAAACICMGLFVLFSYSYFTDWSNSIRPAFFASYQEALELAQSTDSEKIYVAAGINQPYMLTLFYNQSSPQAYIDTVEKNNPGAAFENIKSYDKYHFYMPSEIDVSGAAVYITGRGNTELFDKSLFTITDFEYYSVAIAK